MRDFYRVEFIERRKGVFGLSLVRNDNNLPVLDFYGEYNAYRTRADVLPETEAWANKVCAAMNTATKDSQKLATETVQTWLSNDCKDPSIQLTHGAIANLEIKIATALSKGELRP